MENQKKDSSLEHTLKAVTYAKEAQEIPVGYFVKDGVLVHGCIGAAVAQEVQQVVH